MAEANDLYGSIYQNLLDAGCDQQTTEQRNKIKRYLSEQRWKDAETGTFALGNHEIAFHEENEPITGMMEVPERLPEKMHIPAIIRKMPMRQLWNRKNW